MKLNVARAMLLETGYDGRDTAYYAHDDRSTLRILDVVKERKGFGASGAKLLCLTAYEARVERTGPRRLGGRFALSPLALELMDAYGPGCGLMYSRPLFHMMNAWAEEARREPTWRDLLLAWGPERFKYSRMKPVRHPGGGRAS